MQLLGTLKPTPPYNLQITLDLLGRHDFPWLDAVHQNTYFRVLHTANGVALLCAQQSGTRNEPSINVFLVKSIGKYDPAELLQRMAHILGISEDPNPFYAIARQDDILWQIVEPIIGVRWLRTDTMFSALMMTIIEQQIALSAAQRAQVWLLEWGGHKITHEDKTFYAFPKPEQIAAASIETLTPLKITFKRMALMIDVAQMIISDRLNLEAMQQQTIEQIYDALVAIKGIGHWTAVWTIQRAIGQHNYVGHNDVALQAAVNQYYFGGKGRIPAEQVTDTFRKYGEFAGIASTYTIMRYEMDRFPPKRDQ